MARPLTEAEQWVFSTSRKMLAEAREAAAAGRPVDMDFLEKKLAVMLMQARALEARKTRDQLQMRQFTSLSSAMDYVHERSVTWENMGLAYAKAMLPDPGAPGLIVQNTVEGEPASAIKAELEPGTDVPIGGLVN